MPRKHIVVTCRATDEERALIASTLADRADLTFLKDLPRKDRLAAFEKAEALISWFPAREYPEGAYGLMKNARLLQMVSAGVDHVDLDLLPVHVRIAANAGAYAQPMAEHVLAMILAVYKRLPWKHAKLAAGEFDQLSLNRTLRGSVCAILGYGGIGRAVAGILKPLGVRIHAVNSTGTTDQDVEFAGTLTDLETVLKAADIVVVSLALNRSTRRPDRRKTTVLDEGRRRAGQRGPGRNRGRRGPLRAPEGPPRLHGGHRRLVERTPRWTTPSAWTTRSSICRTCWAPRTTPPWCPAPCWRAWPAPPRTSCVSSTGRNRRESCGGRTTRGNFGFGNWDCGFEDGTGRAFEGRRTPDSLNPPLTYSRRRKARDHSITPYGSAAALSMLTNPG